MQKNSLPIGVIDSGVGGVSVLRQLVAILPEEKYIYFADCANSPYGTKTHEEIFNLVNSAVDMLIKRGIKALVVACNTATSVCIDDLRTKYPDMPIVGIEPALKPAVNAMPNPKVVVMATPLTLKEKKFAALCAHYSKEANIVSLPCPKLVEFVESGITDSLELEEYLKDKFLSADAFDADCVVLGCTHFPFAGKTVEKLVPNAKLFDGGEGTARRLKDLLEKNNLLGNKSGVTFENSLNSDREKELCERLLCMK